MASSVNPHSQSRLRLRHTHTHTHEHALKYSTYTVINVHLLADDVTQKSAVTVAELQLRLKLLKGAIDRWNFEAGGVVVAD